MEERSVNNGFDAGEYLSSEDVPSIARDLYMFLSDNDVKVIKIRTLYNGDTSFTIDRKGYKQTIRLPRKANLDAYTKMLKDTWDMRDRY